MGRRRAFTLLEMLVTVAIIATLAALLVPAFSAISYQLRLMKCRNNLVAVHRVLIDYAEASQGRFPEFHSYYGGSIFHAGKSYETPDVTMSDAILLKKLGATMETWFCPFDPYYGRDSWYRKTWTTTEYTLSIGYTMLINRKRAMAEGPRPAAFTDQRLSPISLDCEDDTPLVADLLRCTGDGRAYGWLHGGGAGLGETEGLMNSSCHTMFRGGWIQYNEWSQLERQGFALNMASPGTDAWWFWLGREARE